MLFLPEELSLLQALSDAQPSEHPRDLPSGTHFQTKVSYFHHLYSFRRRIPGKTAQLKTYCEISYTFILKPHFYQKNFLKHLLLKNHSVQNLAIHGINNHSSGFSIYIRRIHTKSPGRNHSKIIHIKPTLFALFYIRTICKLQL